MTPFLSYKIVNMIREQLTTIANDYSVPIRGYGNVILESSMVLKDVLYVLLLTRVYSLYCWGTYFRIYLWRKMVCYYY